MAEWDVIAFGDVNDETPSVTRVTAPNEDEAVKVFSGRFAVAFPVKDPVPKRQSAAENLLQHGNFLDGFRNRAWLANAG